MNLNEKEIIVLRAIIKTPIENQLKKNWEICDKYGSRTNEYETASEECRTLKSLAEKLSVQLSEHIISRF